MHQNLCLLVFAFLPLPFPHSYVVLTRLPSTRTGEHFGIVTKFEFQKKRQVRSELVVRDLGLCGAESAALIHGHVASDGDTEESTRNHDSFKFAQARIWYLADCL